MPAKSRFGVTSRRCRRLLFSISCARFYSTSVTSRFSGLASGEAAPVEAAGVPGAGISRTVVAAAIEVGGGTREPDETTT